MITGISSIFRESLSSPGALDIQVGVADHLSGQIFDIEIYFDVQDPPWEGAQGQQAPPGWRIEQIVDGNGNVIGIRFVTDTDPIVAGQPIHLGLVMQPPTALGNFIILYLTDEKHQIIGQSASQRVTDPN